MEMQTAFPAIKERILSERSRRSAGLQRSVRLFTMADLSILVGREAVNDTGSEVDLRWHISISAKDREPTWKEIKHVQNKLKPGVFFCMPMPPERYWISIHDHCYHLWEIDDENLIETWRQELTG